MAVRMTPYSLGFDPLVVGLPGAVSRVVCVSLIFSDCHAVSNGTAARGTRVVCVRNTQSYVLSRAFIACRRGDTDTRKHTDVDRGQNARFQSTRQDS